MERPRVMPGGRSRGQLAALVSGVLVIAGLAISLAVGTSSSQASCETTGYSVCVNPQTLTVSKNGTGGGLVLSAPPAIECSPSCSDQYELGTVVTLFAHADDGSQFAGWSGSGCSGTGTCTVTMDAAKAVTATFNTAPPKTLTVNKNGSGSGTVTSLGGQINCGALCSASFPFGTDVLLTATPDAGSALTGWSGCEQVAHFPGDPPSDQCVADTSADTSVTVTFDLTRTLTVTKNGSGSGLVQSVPAHIFCGATCTHDYNDGTVVTLTATPAAGSAFTGWSGAGCSGTGTCIVTMDAAKAVTATFTLQTYTLTVSKSGNGSGSVSSSPAGIDCGATCSASYDYGTSVTLTAAAASSSFSGWSGAGCSGTGTCTVTMDAAKSVTATFNTTLPTAVDDSRRVNEDSSANVFRVRTNDLNADGVVIESVSDPAHGTAALANGGLRVSYTPDPDYCNPSPQPDDTFTYTLNGGSTATVSVNVKCVAG